MPVINTNDLQMQIKNKKIAVLLPCYNESLTIEKVIKDFKKVLPTATIYVYDNNSTDNTGKLAKKSGAIVKKEFRQGKGNVVKSMFRDIDADIYIMVDGDGTYPVHDVHKLIAKLIYDDAAMVVGDRHSNGNYKNKNTRKFHNFGNNLVKYLINKLYGTELNDMMSGFRVFSNDFVRHFSIHSKGFEIETEMSMHALDKNFKISEVNINYLERVDGSFSKLNTYSDGAKILKTIFWLFKNYKPLAFFSLLSLFFFIFALFAGIPVIVEFINTSYINKIPSAILAVGLTLISVISLFVGFILDTVVRQHREYYDLMRRKKN